MRQTQRSTNLMSLQEFVIDEGNVPGLASQSPAPRHTCGHALISSSVISGFAGRSVRFVGSS